MFESIGQRLKKERISRFLTLERVSEATRIRLVFLKALEADDYSVMPSAAQGRGFLRNYAAYLDLDIDEMIADIQKNPPKAEEVSGPLPEVNLVETEVPPLTTDEDEASARPSLGSWLRSLLKVEPQKEQTENEVEKEPVQEVAVVEEVKEEQPKPRGRKKKAVEEEIPQPASIESPAPSVAVTEATAEALEPPVEQNPLQVEGEAKPGLLSRLMSTFQVRVQKAEPEVIPENVEPEPKPESKPELQQSVPSKPASVIFAEIGQQLRERRELISLTVEEVERHTKLRVPFVKALEEGALDKLPSPVQTRGMLANYATFLDLDTDAILLRFADGLQARRHEKYAEIPREKVQTEVVTSMPFWRSFIAGDLIFGAMMVAVLFGLAIWGVGRLVSLQEDQAIQPTAPSIVDVLGSTPLPTPSLEVTSVPLAGNPQETQAAGAAATAETNANVVISIFAVERVFVRISVDGEVALEGRIAPGETKTFEANDQVMILTGNAAALRVTYNGKDLGLMGNVGEVVNRVYLISGVVTPTATISPTPTITPPATITPTPTLTPTFTPTVTPPDGG